MRLSLLPATVLLSLSLAACALGTEGHDDTERSASAIVREGTDPPEPPVDTIAPPPPPPPPTVAQIAASFTNYDLNGDGVREIDAIQLMPWESAADPLGAGPMVLVLVDPRLLSSTGLYTSAVSNSLRTLRDDLVREGYRPRVLVTDVYSGPRRQDGRTLLAMRRFLQTVRAYKPSLAGAMLVGSFPEATLFRRTLVVGNGEVHVHSERINTRADLVLADLDGRWESLYVERGAVQTSALKPFSMPAMPWPAGTVLQGPALDWSTTPWDDYFYVQDDSTVRLSTLDAPAGTSVSLRVDSIAQRHPELHASDLTGYNPIARPEITVSRINARGVALEPSAPTDRLGRKPLDANGRPQILEYDLGPTPAVTFPRSFDLEQRLIVDYLGRNHQFRIGIDHWLPYRTSSISTNNGLPTAGGPDGYNAMLKTADPTGFGAGHAVEFATLLSFAQWLKVPGVLRGYIAHSNMWGSAFLQPAAPPEDLPFDFPELANTTYSAADLEREMGGPPFRWVPNTVGNTITLTPTAEGFGSFANWSFYRAMHQYGGLRYAGQSFYVHNGCSVSTSDNQNGGMSYDNPIYSNGNNAESILFFLNGLGIYARGKVFNDWPAGIGRSRVRFGNLWRDHFAANFENASLNPNGATDDRVLHNKQAYFWTLFGDFTLRYRY